MPEPTIAVGVDGSPASHSALRFALTEATRRAGRVRVITAWTWIGDHARYASVVAPKLAQQTQDRTIESVLTEADAVPPIDRSVLEGLPAQALVAASRDCDLLVVGTNHKGILKRVMDGSVSAYCVRHSQIPVAVVPFIDDGLESLVLDSEVRANCGSEPADIEPTSSRT